MNLAPSAIKYKTTQFTNPTIHTKQQLTALAQARRGVIVPGAFNALSARVVADLLFVEAVTELEHVRALPQRLSTPQLMNMVIGGKTPIFNADELGALGFGFVLYANAALQGAVAGMQKCLTLLRDEHKVDEDPAIVAPFLERQRLVNKDFWDGLEQKYK